MARGQLIPTFASGDSSGKGKRILISATSNGGANTLHLVSSDTYSGAYRFIDYITIDAQNSGTVARSLHLLWGGTSEPADLIRVDLPPGLPTQVVVEALPLTGGLTVKAYASAANEITVGVRVDRYQVV